MRENLICIFTLIRFVRIRILLYSCGILIDETVRDRPSPRRSKNRPINAEYLSLEETINQINWL